MSYTINGVTLSLQPTSGKWNNRELIGVDGNGHAVYSGMREFELQWGFMTFEQFREIQNLFESIGSTGTAVVQLPEYGALSWQFREYSGTVLQEPKAEQYFETYVSNVSMLIVKIKT